MDQLISDQYYDKTRAFIQEHAKATFLSEEIQNKLIELYNTLTIENAKQIYESATTLYYDAARENMRQFNLSCFKFAGTGILMGSGISLVGYLGTKFTDKDCVSHKVFDYTMKGGGGVILLSVCFMFAIGH